MSTGDDPSDDTTMVPTPTAPDPFAIVPGVNPGDPVASVWGNQVVTELNAREYRAGITGTSASIGVGSEAVIPVIFSTPMPDANYVPTATEAGNNAHACSIAVGNKTANGFDIRVQNDGTAAYTVQLCWAAFTAR